MDEWASSGRRGRIRTGDLLLPKQARSPGCATLRPLPNYTNVSQRVKAFAPLSALTYDSFAMATRTIVERLKRDLEAAYRGSQWHSFRSALKDITPEEASWTPPAFKGFPWMRGSILEIVFHVGGDSFYQLDYALGDRRLTWEELQRRYQAEGGDLQAAIKLAEEGYQTLQRVLDSLTDEDLARTYPTPEGKGERSLEDFFRMMIEHHLYHAGQIVYARCLQQGLQEEQP